MSRSIITSVAILLSLSSCAQKEIIIPNGFVQTEIPKYDSKEWHNANHSSNEFNVVYNNGKLEVTRLPEYGKFDSCKLELTDGLLIGSDRGEWGGELLFIGDKYKKIQRIVEGNIKYLFKFQDKIYIIDGLTHMGYNHGDIYELIKKDTTFTYKKVLDFNDAPEAFTIYKNQLLIATYENFYLIKDFKKQLLFKDTFWGSLFPNSIAAIDDRNIFLGIRSGIVKLDLIDKKMFYYKWKE